MKNLILVVDFSYLTSLTLCLELVFGISILSESKKQSNFSKNDNLTPFSSPEYVFSIKESTEFARYLKLFLRRFIRAIPIYNSV